MSSPRVGVGPESNAGKGGGEEAGREGTVKGDTEEAATCPPASQGSSHRPHSSYTHHGRRLVTLDPQVRL